MFAIVITSPVGSSVTYAALLVGVLLCVVIYWPQVRERHATDPRVVRIALAFLLAVIVATAGAMGSGGIYTCTPDHITSLCGDGGSWCRSYWEWSCWLSGFSN